MFHIIDPRIYGNISYFIFDVNNLKQTALFF